MLCHVMSCMCHIIAYHVRSDQFRSRYVLLRYVTLYCVYVVLCRVMLCSVLNLNSLASAIEIINKPLKKSTFHAVSFQFLN